MRSEPVWLELDGGRLECLRVSHSGPAGAPTLVFLHGGLASVSSWRGFPARLCAATGLDGFVYSRLGHGRSDPAPPRWSTDFMHDEALQVLPRVLRESAIASPILVGHSDGASIALIYAGSTPPAAPAPRALVLEAPHVFVEACTTSSIAALRQRFAEGRSPRQGLERHHGAGAAALVEAWTGVWLDPAFRDWRIDRAVARVGCPTLVVQGVDDEFGTRAQIDAVAAGCRAEAHLLGGCSHVPHRDAADTVVKLAAEFVERTLRVRPGSG